MKKYPLLLALFLLPLLCLLLFYQNKRSRLEELKSTIAALEVSARQAAKEKELQKELEATVDPHFLDKYVESLVFLEPEIKRLQALHTHHPNNDSLAKRLYFLKEGQNKLTLIEEKRDRNGIEQKLQHPIEMNEEDLKKLLVLVEGVLIHPYIPKKERPDLAFLEFDLSKKQGFGEEEVYVVDFTLVKR